MKTDEIRLLFATDFSNPGADKDGNYLYEIIFQRAQLIISENRDGLIEVLTEWLEERIEPDTMLAVYLSSALGLYELKCEILKLREDVSEGKVFLPFYLKDIDECLASLDNNLQ